MDSGLEECILPSIRRIQMLLTYRIGGVDNPETFGQIACTARLSEGSRPSVRSRARSGDRHDQEQEFLGGHRRHDQFLDVGRD